MDSLAFIERWKDGDERAAEVLFNQYKDQTFRLAYGMLGHRADAEEVAQDALTYALVNIHRYDASRAKFSTWLHTITVSRCRDKRRRKILPQFSLTAWLNKGYEVEDKRPSPEKTTKQYETRGEVWQAVQTLKPNLREAIILRYWAGYTYREMADILGCPLPTAQSRVRLAYKYLREELTESQLENFQLSSLQTK